MREARNIEEAVARNATGDMHPVSTPPAELDTTWLKQGSKICASPKAQDHGKDRRRDASIGDNEQASHHRAPIPSDWEGKTNVFCREVDRDGTNGDGVGAGVTTARRSAEEY